MVIIGICGFQSAGKDTFSNYLVNNYGFKKFSFAESTKDVFSKKTWLSTSNNSLY